MGIDLGENVLTVGQNGITFHDTSTQSQAGIISNATVAAGGSGTITNIVVCAQGTYDAIGSKNAGTLYLING